MRSPEAEANLQKEGALDVPSAVARDLSVRAVTRPPRLRQLVLLWRRDLMIPRWWKGRLFPRLILVPSFVSIQLRLVKDSRGRLMDSCTFPLSLREESALCPMLFLLETRSKSELEMLIAMLGEFPFP